MVVNVFSCFVVVVVVVQIKDELFDGLFFCPSEVLKYFRQRLLHIGVILTCLPTVDLIPPLFAFLRSPPETISTSGLRGQPAPSPHHCVSKTEQAR